MRHGRRPRSLVLLHQLSLCQSGCARLSCAAVTTERGEGQFGPQTRCQDYLLRNPLDLRQDLALAKPCQAAAVPPQHQAAGWTKFLDCVEFGHQQWVLDERCAEVAGTK